MGNRHHDKKLRAEVRARMARTGETYQQALERIRGRRRARDPRDPEVDLVAIDWFGGTAALATIRNMGITSFFVVSAPASRGPFAVPMRRIFATG